MDNVVLNILLIWFVVAANTTNLERQMNENKSTVIVEQNVQNSNDVGKSSVEGRISELSQLYDTSSTLRQQKDKDLESLLQKKTKEIQYLTEELRALQNLTEKQNNLLAANKRDTKVL